MKDNPNGVVFDLLSRSITEQQRQVETSEPAMPTYQFNLDLVVSFAIALQGFCQCDVDGESVSLSPKHILTLYTLLITERPGEARLFFTQGDLTHVFEKTTAMTTGVSGRLEKLRLVTRGHPPGDNRKVVFSLTKAGRRLISKQIRAMRNVANAILNPSPKAEESQAQA